MMKKKEPSGQPIVLSVDSYDDKIISGRFWCGREGSEVRFTGLMQLLLLVEKTLDEMQGPPGERCKSFVCPDAAQVVQELSQPADPTRGAFATFQLQILFQQNTSWQGLLTWEEAREEESFRSVLELASLLDSALTYAGELRAR